MVHDINCRRICCNQKLNVTSVNSRFFKVIKSDPPSKIYWFNSSFIGSITLVKMKISKGCWWLKFIWCQCSEHINLSNMFQLTVDEAATAVIDLEMSRESIVHWNFSFIKKKKANWICPTYRYRSKLSEL